MIDAISAQQVEIRRSSSSLAASSRGHFGSVSLGSIIPLDSPPSGGAPQVLVDQSRLPIRRRIARERKGEIPIFQTEIRDRADFQELPGSRAYGSNLYGERLIDAQTIESAPARRGDALDDPRERSFRKRRKGRSFLEQLMSQWRERFRSGDPDSDERPRDRMERKAQKAERQKKPAARERRAEETWDRIPSPETQERFPRTETGKNPAEVESRERIEKPEIREKPKFNPQLLGYLSIPLVFIALLLGVRYLAENLPWVREGARLSPLEDKLYQRNMASYAGLGDGEALFHRGEDIPLDLMETFAWQTYRVKDGDSVSRIAADHGISMDAVIASNGLTDARRVFTGQEIRIPNMDGIPYVVKKGDSYSKIASSMGAPLAVILDANDIQNDVVTPGTTLFLPGVRMKTEDLKLALGELFVNPVQGRLTSRYGWRNDPKSGVRRYHAALDIAAPLGTMIKAAMEGRVASVGYNATYGNFIILSHSGGYQTMYAHLSKISVVKGAWASQGSKVGEVGSTGYSTGNHLHFAVYKNGRAVNPLDYLNY